MLLLHRFWWSRDTIFLEFSGDKNFLSFLLHCCKIALNNTGTSTRSSVFFQHLYQTKKKRLACSQQCSLPSAFLEGKKDHFCESDCLCIQTSFLSRLSGHTVLPSSDTRLCHSSCGLLECSPCRLTFPLVSKCRPSPVMIPNLWLEEPSWGLSSLGLSRLW